MPRKRKTEGNWSARLPKECPECGKRLFYGQCQECGFGINREPPPEKPSFEGMPSADDFAKHLGTGRSKEGEDGSR
jgi:hypothetical protein